MRDFLDRFNDVGHINQLLKTTRFNNQLLIPIKILKKISFNQYKLIIGSKEITTKSYIELEEGIKYWAELSSSKEGGINLSSLKRQPDILQLDKFPLSFEVDSISQILKLDNCADYIKKVVLEALSDSNNKFEFEFLISLLSSIEQGVLSIPFVYNKKYNIAQFSKIKSGVSFFITTNNLGTLEGFILKEEENYILHVNTFFKNGFDYISSHMKDLLGQYFHKIHVNLDDEINPLFTFRYNQSFSI